jgi:hypothetical protein
MLDYNHRPKFHERVGAVIDEALARERASQTPRRYLGASRLGVACERALQYEYAQAPVDPGRKLPGRALRVFEVGHALEDLAIRWLCLAGFELYTRKAVMAGSSVFPSPAAASRGTSTASWPPAPPTSGLPTPRCGSARR